MRCVGFDCCYCLLTLIDLCGICVNSCLFGLFDFCLNCLCLLVVSVWLCCLVICCCDVLFVAWLNMFASFADYLVHLFVNACLCVC